MKVSVKRKGMCERVWGKGLGWESLVKGPKVFAHLDEGESVSKYQGLKGSSHNSLGFSSVLLLSPEFSEVYCSRGLGYLYLS